MTNKEAIESLRENYCCNRVVCELHSNNLCQTDKCEIWMAISALEAQNQQWIPCYPSELPTDKILWVTHDNGEYRWVDKVHWDMTEWSDRVSDVVAYMQYVELEPYQEGE